MKYACCVSSDGGKMLLTQTSFYIDHIYKETAMFFPDYHLHSHFSTDSEAELHAIIESAKEKGITEICLTDHHDIDFPLAYSYEPGVMAFQLDLPTYKETISSLKEELAPDFTLRLGVELGVMPSTTKKAKAFVSANSDLDFVICSTHIVDGIDPYFPEYYEGKTDSEGFRRYFEVILETVKDFTDFDCYGHLDYIVRYGRNKNRDFSFPDYRDIFEAIFKIIIPAGRGIEINTASLYHDMDVPHPASGILMLYKEMGGEIITVGSDAHTPDKVGYGFDVARDFLLSHGFTHYCTFNHRIPEFHKIP